MTKPSALPTPWTASLTLALRLPTPNQLLRMHWSARSRMTKTFAMEAWLALALQSILRPATPLSFATITVARYSPSEPDPDALRGCAKPLLDALQPASKRHPYGLGIIVNDDRKSIDLTVLHVPCKRGVVRTDIRIIEGHHREASA